MDGRGIWLINVGHKRSSLSANNLTVGYYYDLWTYKIYFKVALNATSAWKCYTIVFINDLYSLICNFWSRNQRTFRPKKSAPSGSKVVPILNSHILLKMLFQFFCCFPILPCGVQSLVLCCHLKFPTKNQCYEIQTGPAGFTGKTRNWTEHNFV